MRSVLLHPAHELFRKEPLIKRSSSDIFSDTGIRAWLRRHSLIVLYAAYVLIFAIFFWGIRAGVGQFWDWSFPYFGDQTHNIFANKDSAWIAANAGSPLGYASDYFFRFVMSLFIFMPPEFLHYVLLVIIFASGAFGMYLLARPYTSGWLAFLLGLLAFINPTIFYKYTAGHFNYLLSFTLFIYFVHYLLHRFDKNLYSAVMVGLLFGLIGIQIQFFIIAGIFMLTFLLLNRQKVSLKYLAIMLLMPLLLNLVWLSNFLTGGASTTETSAAAAKVGFKQSSGSTFLNIFTFSFSKATLLSKFYAFYELLWNASLFIFLLWLLVKEKRKERFDVALLVFLVVMIFLATGLYQVLQLYPLTVLYPMLREVGHFAPVIVLVALLLIARMVQRSRLRWALLLVLTGSLFIVGVKFQYFSQAYDAGAVRAQFAPFKKIADEDKGEYRILAYPFFDKYELKNEKPNEPGVFPLRNSGHDSFAAYASQDFMQNAIAPHEFQDSPQYKLLQSYSIDVLRPYNVKYIFDFSQIYESDYDLYVPAATYNNDLKLIKNDPKFFEKLMAANPGRLRKVNDRVLEIIDYMPRALTTAQVFSVPKDEQAIETSTFTREQLQRAFDYVDEDPAIAPYTTKLTRLFDSPKRAKLDKSSGTFSQTVQIADNGNAKLYLNRSYRTLYYEATPAQLTIYSEAAAPLLLNGEPLGDTQTSDRHILTQIQLTKNGPYYISFQGEVTPIEPGKSGRLGTGKAGDELELLRAESENLVTNGSFEDGLWQRSVGDCNEYDGSGRLDMKRDAGMASHGDASLQLSATRHNACTMANVQLERETQYLISMDYQSGNAPTASFYLAYADEFMPITKGSRAITDNKWHTMTSTFTTEAGFGRNARLFLYALEGDGKTATANRYDNVQIVKLSFAGKVSIPQEGASHATIDLPGGKQQFAFQDDGYQYRNLIANPSFEQGSWQPKVGDCNNYDARAAIAMRTTQETKSAGRQSLELSATRHDACVRATANVSAGTDYLLRFDYQTEGTKTYGYAISFDDPGASIVRKQLESKGKDWQTADIQIHTPANASTMTLYLYAFESNGRSANIVRYDNVSLVALPDFTDRFFVVQNPSKQVGAPAKTIYTAISRSVRKIEITKATAPFFVVLGESYHPKWRLELDNAAAGGPLNRWLPNAKPDTAGIKHVELSGAVNAWLVDPAKLCQAEGQRRAGCTIKADGSYNMQLLAEFVPQRWFAMNAILSWAALLGCLGYLIFARRQDILPTYHYLRDRVAARNRRKL